GGVFSPPPPPGGGGGGRNTGPGLFRPRHTPPPLPADEMICIAFWDRASCPAGVKPPRLVRVETRGGLTDGPCHRDVAGVTVALEHHTGVQGAAARPFRDGFLRDTRIER